MRRYFDFGNGHHSTFVNDFDPPAASASASRRNRATRSESCRKLVGQNFDGDIALQFRVVSTKHTAYSAFAYLRGDLVRTKLGTNRDGHLRWRD
jgi:hypothetical protein